MINALPLPVRRLNAEDILRIWEIGQPQHWLDRAITILSVACPTQTWPALTALPIGQRDALLLNVRELTFGHHLNGFAECPHCQKPLEFAFEVADIRVPVLTDPDRLLKPQTCLIDDIDLQFRLPNSRDLGAIVNQSSVDSPVSLQQQLVQQCLLQAHRQGEHLTLQQLPAAAIQRLIQTMAELDPQAEILLDFQCPDCGQPWNQVFDIIQFFWTELSVRAKRLLREIHLLARAYGWREADVLALSDFRRQCYLEMVQR